MRVTMVRTGRDYGAFGGALALITAYLIFAVGLSLIRFGEYPAHPGTEEIAGAGGFRETVVTLLGMACTAGGITGIAGGALAQRRPRLAWKLMAAAGAFSLLSVFGLLSGTLFIIGSVQALDFSKAPPGTLPEWQDAESLPY